MNHDNPTMIDNAELRNMVTDIANGESVYLHNAKEVAELSRIAHSSGGYTPQFEDHLARNLKYSMMMGRYKRTSLETPPPASLATALRSRV